MKLLLTSILICVIHQGLSSSALPSELKVCSKHSSDFNECIGTQIEIAVRLFAHGSEKFNVKSLDPMHYDRIELKPNTPNSPNFDFTDSDLHGLSTLKVLEVSNDWKHLHFKYFCEQNTFNGTYKVDGNFLGHELEGQGQFFITYYNYTGSLTLCLKPVEREGKKYFHVLHSILDVFPQKAEFHFGNLFNGDKKKGEEANKLLNDNWQDLAMILRPVISENFSDYFQEVIGKILGKIPIDEIDID